MLSSILSNGVFFQWSKPVSDNSIVFFIFVSSLYQMFFSCTIVAATFLYPSLLPNYSFTMSIITFPFIFQLLVEQTLPLMSLFLPHNFLPLQTACSLSGEVRPLTPSVTANSNITFKLLRETTVCLCIDVYLDNCFSHGALF